MKTLFLAWQAPQSRAWFPIGRLTYNGQTYTFCYTQGALSARREGFLSVYSFPELEKVYRCDELFPLFSNRLMKPSRPEYSEYLKWLDIPQDSDDPIALLARSGGQKATDSFEIFPKPEPDENGLFHIHAFAHGLRYFPDCNIERVNSLEKGEPLSLMQDRQNPVDPFVLILRTEDLHDVGFCPKYLSEDVSELLSQTDFQLNAVVERVNLAPTPIQFRLLYSLTAAWPSGFRPFSNSDYGALHERSLVK